MANEPGSAKRSSRMCTSLVGKCLGEPGWAKFFEAREKLIKVQAKEPYKYTWTNRRSNAARQRRSRQKADQRDINACYIIPVVRFVSVCGIICQSQQKDGVSGLQRDVARTAIFKASIPRRGNAKSTERSWEAEESPYSLQYQWISRFCPAPTFAAGLELLSLTYTTTEQTGTPGAVA